MIASNADALEGVTSVAAFPSFAFGKENVAVLSLTQVECPKLLSFGGRIVVLGFGSIGSGVVPLLLRHISLPSSRVTIITAPDRGEEAREAASRYKLGGAIITALTAQNFGQVSQKVNVAPVSDLNGGRQDGCKLASASIRMIPCLPRCSNLF